MGGPESPEGPRTQLSGVTETQRSVCLRTHHWCQPSSMVVATSCDSVSPFVIRKVNELIYKCFAVFCFRVSALEGSNRDYQQGAYFLSISLRITSTAWDGYEVTLRKGQALSLSPRSTKPSVCLVCKILSLLLNRLKA